MQKKTLIPYYIPGECRQMRLDRILFSKGFPALAIAPCILWANEAIKAEDYLFPSDHFGLSIDIVPKVTEKYSETIPLGEPDPSANEILRQNAENKADAGPYRQGIARTTTALAAHLVRLGAKSVGLK